MKDPQANIKLFQNDPKCRVMIANEQAGGAGVNLTAASYSIYYSRTYSFLNRSQSESRNHRSGSEIHSKITIIDLIIKGTIEEVVFQALARKENFSDNVLERIRALR
jgi:SNF2 family DNA or RNA helicase